MIILGVDGGATKTQALALDENGTILGKAVLGPCNYHNIGLSRALDVLGNVSRMALDGKRADIAVYCVCACDSDIDERRLTDGLTAVDLSARLVCTNDSFAALRAGTARPYGVAVICGTGFNACGIAPDGQRAHLYSQGALTGDWGGGYSIGEAIFAAVYRADEGRAQATILTPMLLEALDFPDLRSLSYRITDHSISNSMVAALAPLAFEAAEAGDDVARGIIIRQGDEIVTAELAILRRLGMTDVPVDVIVAG